MHLSTMNEQALLHWDFFRQPLQPSPFPIGPAFYDVRSKETGLDPNEGMNVVGARILELRKEKSRDAARSRRGKENYEFYELAKLLPLPAAITSQLDKASIIRLSISYLKLRDFSCHGDPPWSREGHQKGSSRRHNSASFALELFENHHGTHLLQSLDGFVFALTNDGRFLYISETVSIYLGLSQVEMTGSSIFDYIHPQDMLELADQIGLCLPQSTNTGSIPSPGSSSDDGSSSRSVSSPIPERASLMTVNHEKGYHRSFCIRMKSTLTKRGVHVKSSGYRVVHVVGKMRPQISFTVNRKHSAPILGMICIGLAMPPPTISELRIENDVFIMRLNPDFKIIHCEQMISKLMDLTAEYLTDKPLYEFCHPADLPILRRAHVDLLSKGQEMSEYYRIMNRHGGYVWIQTCATTLYNTKSAEENGVLAINYVLSGIECADCIMDQQQLDMTVNKEHDTSDHTDHSEHGSDFGPGNDKDHDDGSPRQSTPENSDHNNDHADIMNFSSTNNKSSVRDDADLENSFSVHSESLEDCDVFHNCVENSHNICSRNDAKNSRRKTDKPRKRKRDQDLECSVSEMSSKESNSKHSQIKSRCLDYNVLNSSDLHNNRSQNNVADKSCSLTSSSDSLQQSSGPEDLSLKLVSSSTTSLSQSPDSPSTSKAEMMRIIGQDQQVYSDIVGISSVKELEEAMNKHLPVGAGECLTKSIDAIGKDFTGIFQRQKSAIQWVGSQQTSETTAETLPASNFLRNLHAYRESVIRTNTRPQYYSDISVNMLTPPENHDTCKEPVWQSTQAVSMTPSNIRSVPTITPYTVTPISVSTGMNSVDSFRMTPPSSVSPHDKIHSPFEDGTCGNRSSPMCDINIGDRSSKSSLYSAITQESHPMKHYQTVYPPVGLEIPQYPYRAANLSSFDSGAPSSLWAYSSPYTS